MKSEKTSLKNVICRIYSDTLNWTQNTSLLWRSFNVKLKLDYLFLLNGRWPGGIEPKLDKEINSASMMHFKLTLNCMSALC